MSDLYDVLVQHSERYQAHLNKQKADLERIIHDLKAAGSQIPKELTEALQTVEKDLKDAEDMKSWTEGFKTGKFKSDEEDPKPSKPKAKAKKVLNHEFIEFKDDTPKGQLTRALNAEMGFRQDFKVFVPQVFGWDSYKPFDDFTATVIFETTSKGKRSPMGLNRHVRVDAMPKLKVVKDWMVHVDISSPTDHREWLASDSERCSKKSKAKLNNLLRELFELEKSVSLYFAKCHPTPDKRQQAIENGLIAALFLQEDVRESVQFLIVNALRNQLKHLFPFYVANRLRMWGVTHNVLKPGPMRAYQPPEDDSSDDSSFEFPGDEDSPPITSVVYTPFGPKYLHGGPKHK